MAIQPFKFSTRLISLYMVVWGLLFGADVTQAETKSSFTEKQLEIKEKLWLDLLSDLKLLNSANYLEINPLDGRTTIFVFEKVLKSSLNTGVLLQNEDDENSKNLLSNLKSAGISEKITIFSGGVVNYLKSSKLERYDLVVINGSMLGKYIANYLQLAWSTLKVGGYIIFWPDGAEVIPKADSPMNVLKTFLPLYFDEVETLKKRDLVVLKKRINPCAKITNCYRLVNSIYLPLESRLINLDQNKKYQLTREESESLRDYLSDTRKSGESEITVFDHLKKDPILKALVERTGLAIKL